MPGAQRTAIGVVGNDGRVDRSRLERTARRRRGHPRHAAVQAGLARMAAGKHDRDDRAGCAVRRKRACRSSQVRARSSPKSRSSQRPCRRAAGGSRGTSRRRVQAAQLAVLVPGTRKGGPRSCSRSRDARPACRSSLRRWTTKARISSRKLPTASRSARATCRTIRCSRRSGSIGKPVLLKRGMAATITDLLLSAEYILAEGNSKVILCERGVRTLRHVGAQHVRSHCNSDRAETVASADHCRSESRNRRARQCRSNGARRGRGRRRRHPRRDASASRPRAVRWRAVVVSGSVDCTLIVELRAVAGRDRAFRYIHRNARPPTG